MGTRTQRFDSSHPDQIQESILMIDTIEDLTILPKGWITLKAYCFQDFSPDPNLIRLKAKVIYHVESFTGYPARHKDTGKPAPKSPMVTDGCMVRVADVPQSGASYILWDSEQEVLNLISEALK